MYGSDIAVPESSGCSFEQGDLLQHFVGDLVVRLLQHCFWEYVSGMHLL